MSNVLCIFAQELNLKTNYVTNFIGKGIKILTFYQKNKVKI